MQALSAGIFALQTQTSSSIIANWAFTQTVIAIFEVLHTLFDSTAAAICQTWSASTTVLVTVYKHPVLSGLDWGNCKRRWR